ncbi:hypothetical protein GCK32_019063, partial [Trichostrongylus colubriformis]
MSGVNSVVTVFQNLFSNHGSTFLNIVLVVSTIGGQSIIRKLTFACPCAYPLNIVHSLVFMVGPAVALLIIGIVLNTTTWKIVHGTCFRAHETRHTWSTLYASWVEVAAQALLAPAAWLFVVFLDGGSEGTFNWGMWDVHIVSVSDQHRMMPTLPRRIEVFDGF